MDEDWVFERHWPESMRLPSDGKKRVYLLEAYHQLHCLVSELFRAYIPTLPELADFISESFKKPFGRQ